MEMDMIYRLSLLVGFLSGGFLILLIAALVVGVCVWQKSMIKDACRMLDEEIEKIEEGTPCENEH